MRSSHIGVGAWSFLFWNLGLAYFVFIPLFPSSARLGVAPLIYWQITALIAHTLTILLWLVLWKWLRHGMGTSLGFAAKSLAGFILTVMLIAMVRQIIVDRDIINGLLAAAAAAAGSVWLCTYLSIPFVIDALAGYISTKLR